ncbi:hypothetical protein TcarDRAFT_1404 [Thermosinus carboxydivorans Nor1]|uniref:HipA-like kinase domain-containing protein n=1 Tax=Thermosinus carboxydivorans Nor1 TaxID=401526 RepID=A1HR69_9FIRM|nr:HipA family kinase [Thermosinus carboxydivorans]EAX47386.1 hypothetical protein TcarDRAFT_1404 [Thermosinus carboxydivorans Nor1]
MLRAIRHLGPVGVGATSPQLFCASDGQVYVVKLQNNRLGPKILANEYLAARFGALVGLCFPSADIIYIDEPVLRQSRWLRRANVAPGPHFACRYLSDARYVQRRSLARAENKSELAGVMLFDHMFFNLDRTYNRRNLIVRREETGWRIYAIDNSHLFRRGVWTADGLVKMAGRLTVNYRRSYGVLLKHFLTPRDFAPFVARVQALRDEQLTALVADIPYEWLPDAAERQALVEFLRRRRDLVGEIADRLVRLIPDVNRRADKN